MTDIRGPAPGTPRPGLGSVGAEGIGDGQTDIRGQAPGTPRPRSGADGPETTRRAQMAAGLGGVGATEVVRDADRFAVGCAALPGGPA